MTNVNELEAVTVLNNGVKMYDLSDIVEADTVEAQRVLDTSHYTDVIDAECAYEERIDNPFVGTYEVVIDSVNEYNRFIDMLISEHSVEHIPSFNEWKDNMVVIDGRKQRMGKWLNREGIDVSIIDFYSQQVRTAKETWFFTVSDMPQHIAGMSYNSGTFHSCQHPEQAESTALGGSLHDDTLLIGMLHKELDDVQDMDGNLLARVNMRIVRIDEVLHLVPSRYYGSVSTKAILDRCLVQLGDLMIHSRAVRYDAMNGDMNDRLTIEMQANGSYELTMMGNEWIAEQVTHTEDIDCPMCSGSGEYEVYMDKFNKYVDVCCPMCYGNKTYEVSINEWVETEVEAEEEAELLTYTDDYEHFGNKVRIELSIKYMTEFMEKRK